MTVVRETHDAGKICGCVKDHRPNPVHVVRHHIFPLGEGGPNTEDNIVWVCLAEGSRVLMADGRLQAIEAVHVGDEVMGYDGRPAEVSALSVRPFHGELKTLGGLALTSDHQVFTPVGWRPVGDLDAEPAVLAQPVRDGMDHQMLRLISAQPQVQRPVVGRLPIEMMYDLSGGQGSSENLLHDGPVLDHFPALVAVPNDHNAMSAFVDVSLPFAFEGAGDTIERRLPAVVGAETRAGTTAASTRALVPELATTLVAGRYLPGGLSALGETLVRASPVGPGIDGCGDAKGDAADHAGSVNHSDVVTSGSDARWDTLDHVGSLGYSGRVYDISIPRCRSYYAEGVLVHNCSNAHENVHVLLRAYKTYEGAPPWEIRRRFSPYIRRLAEWGWRSIQAGQLL